LDAYNPLIPDGTNLKATFMLEYPEVAERREALARLLGVEKAVWLQVNGNERIRPIANEDLERETSDKTSAVHFLRFELSSEDIAGFKGDDSVSFGIDHDVYSHQIDASPEIKQALAADLQD